MWSACIVAPSTCGNNGGSVSFWSKPIGSVTRGPMVSLFHDGASWVEGFEISGTQ